MVSSKKMATKTQKLLRLKGGDIVLLVEAWLILSWVDLVMNLLPYSRWSHWLQGPNPRPLEKSSLNFGIDAQVARIIRLSEIAARHHIRPMNCLRRTFAQQRLLRHHHLQSDIHIGVRRAENGLEAHAWLSTQGQVINDAPDVSQGYAELEANQWAKIARFID